MPALCDLMQLSVWDTAGVERFRTLTRNYYRGAQATVFIYSVDEPSSLHYLTSWVRDAESFASTAYKYLIGNKIDLDTHEIDNATADSFAKTHDFTNVFATSAKEGTGLEEAFQKIASDLHEKHASKSGGQGTHRSSSAENPVSGTIDLEVTPPQDAKKNGCC